MSAPSIDQLGLETLRMFAERGSSVVYIETVPDHLADLHKRGLLARRVVGRLNDRYQFDITRAGLALIAAKDSGGLWDFSALTGDATPIALADFFDESSEDLMSGQLEEMRATPVGGTYSVDLGAGGVLTYRRVA